MIATPEEPAPKVFDLSLTRRLLGYVRPYRLYVGIALAVFLAMAVLTNVLPVLIKTAIDQFLSAGAGRLDEAQRLDGILHIGLLYLALSAAAGLIRFAQSYLMAWVGQRIIYDLRGDIFAKVLRMPMNYFYQTPVGRLMTRVTSDVEAMQRMVTDGVVGLTADLFMLLVTTVFMIVISPRLALAMFTILPVLFAGLVIINVRLRRAHRDVRRRQSELNAFTQEALTGMTTIQLFNREQATVRDFGERNQDLRHAGCHSVTWMSCYWPLLEIMRAGAVVLVLLVGGLTILRGSDAVTLGTLVAFLNYIRSFFRPLEDLSDKSSMFQQAMASCERIFNLLDSDEQIADRPDAAPLPAVRGGIEFDRVWFAYTGEDWVLRDFSLNIQPGESVAIVGATGAGKTSVISLVSRFYDVNKGTVRVDGHDVRAVRQHDLRRSMGIVLQDPFIFSGSVAANIDLGNPELSRASVIEAARHVNAHRFITRLPNGYETELTERGETLSTGQKQLLALARAVAQNPDVLLILDEATASVDTETEGLIQEALGRLLHERTSIVIAHRLSTIRHADRILVMRQGEIVESGTHPELIRRSGYYKHLYELLAHEG